MVDDWSYVQSVRVLSQTGHIIYNGWATAMLGWQLYLGALFATLFGPSFTAIRMSTLLVALVTAYFTQRTLMYAGINSRNATIGTFALVLNPVFLPLALSFMSDVGGLFSIVLCFYACLRSLRAETVRGTLGWLAFAALSNAACGTVRQIAWLGVLVMFPCTIWILRRRPYVLVAGVFLYLASVLFIFGALHWFQQQPYSVPVSLFGGHLERPNFVHMVSLFLRFFFVLAMYLTPFLLAFSVARSLRNRRAIGSIAGGGFLCMIAGLFLQHKHALTSWLAPFSVAGSYVSPGGLVDIMFLKGHHPIVLSPGMRVVVTGIVLLALLCSVTFIFFDRTSSQDVSRGVSTALPPVGWNQLLILLLPFTVAYFTLLIPFAVFITIYDRYAPPLILVGIVLLVRLYQDRVKLHLPVLSVVLIVILAVFAVAGTHDAFSAYRARVAAIDELKAAGVPDSAVDGGFDYNGMTQLEHYEYVNDPRIRVPSNFRTLPAPVFPTNCTPEWEWLTPATHPGYALSYDSSACGGSSGFSPISFHDWLGVHTVYVYIVKTSNGSLLQP